jgi:L-histidine N-alpha-methyltransferase
VPTPGLITIETHLTPADIRAGLRADVAKGLSATPKTLPPKWLYDERGCELFDEITRLPEYYPTRREREILAERSAAIARITNADTLVELGSGTSDKTRLLLDALTRAGTLRRFVGFDVAEPTLRDAADDLAREYPGIEIAGVVGDFERHLGHIPKGGRRLVAFLGGTIGNLDPEERATMLATMADSLEPGDTFLLGTDLLKDRQRLVEAYDDAAGVTAAFNLNVLAVINRELKADFDLDCFDHVARFDEEHERIEMRLRARGPQLVRIAELDLDVYFDDGEELRTEISTKFRRERVSEELRVAGLAPVVRWTDLAGDYALTLGRK